MFDQMETLAFPRTCPIRQLSQVKDWLSGFFSEAVIRRTFRDTNAVIVALEDSPKGLGLGYGPY